MFRLTGPADQQLSIERPARWQVSNAQFGAFVRDYGVKQGGKDFVSEAERFGWSFAFVGGIHPEVEKTITQVNQPVNTHD